MAQAGAVSTDGGVDGPLIGDELAGGLACAALALARRFAGGATMWCVAPAWPEHARHVAVEFVHPVVMGTRALPAVSVVDDAPVATLRAGVRPGDIVLAVGAGDDTTVASALRRAGAWGATTAWVGTGRRPGAGAADHVLWVEPDATGDPAHDGGLVLLYHVLWELTHVCLEHPGVLSAGDDGCASEPGCVTCSDEGRLAEVVAAGPDQAEVRSSRGSETVDTMVVGPVQAGDLLLVHAGTVIAVVESAAGEGPLNA